MQDPNTANHGDLIFKLDQDALSWSSLKIKSPWFAVLGSCIILVRPYKTHSTNSKWRNTYLLET